MFISESNTHQWHYCDSLPSHLMMWGKDKEEERLNSDVLKREVKSLGFSSPSCKQRWSFSERPLLSGIMVYSAIWQPIQILQVSNFKDIKHFNRCTFLPLVLQHQSDSSQCRQSWATAGQHPKKRWNKREFCPYLSQIAQRYALPRCLSWCWYRSTFFTNHEFTVFLFVDVLITEDVAGTHHSQFASFLKKKESCSIPYSQVLYSLWLGMKLNLSDLPLMEGQKRPVEGEAFWTSWKNSHSRFYHTQRGPIWI